MTARHARSPLPSRPRNRRRIRALVTQWPLVLPLIALLVAGGVVFAERWRLGAFVVGLAALTAALLRAGLPSERAGLLTVRSKIFDVTLLGAFGLAIMWLALSIDSLGTG